MKLFFTSDEDEGFPRFFVGIINLCLMYVYAIILGLVGWAIYKVM